MRRKDDLMTKKKMITSGQFFLLVFISRISLIMLYSSRISAQEQLQSFLLPLLLLTPLLLITILPLIYLQSQKQLSIAEITENAKKHWLASNKGDIADIKVYINTNQSKAFYVINNEDRGEFDI